MAKRKLRIYAILGTVAGTVLTVLGIRRFVQWYQQGQTFEPAGRQLPENWRTGGATYQPGSQAIPATGAAPAAPPAAGISTAERVNSDRTRDFDDRGTSFATSEMDDTEGDELTGEASEATGRMTGTNVHGDDAYTPKDRDTGSFGGVYVDRNTVETDPDTTSGLGVRPSETGEAAPESRTREQAAQNYTTWGQETPSKSSEIIMDEFVAPLIEHAIAFNSVINLLRSRQREGSGHEGIESLTTGDRNSMRAVLDQMQERVTGYDENAVRKNPLAQRTSNLTRKLRDALDNLDYTGQDLFRIYDEVRRDLCMLTRELENSGQVTITGLDQIRQLYEC